MRFLADENCDMTIVRALRDTGHDVALIRDLCRGATDDAVVALAQKEQRILLTEDKDFGRLAQALSAGSVGVVLIRFPTQARSEIGKIVVKALSGLEAPLDGAFAVVEPGQFRVTRLRP